MEFVCVNFIPFLPRWFSVAECKNIWCVPILHQRAATHGRNMLHYLCDCVFFVGFIFFLRNVSSLRAWTVQIKQIYCPHVYVFGDKWIRECESSSHHRDGWKKKLWGWCHRNNQKLQIKCENQLGFLVTTTTKTLYSATHYSRCCCLLSVVYDAQSHSWHGAQFVCHVEILIICLSGIWMCVCRWRARSPLYVCVDCDFQSFSVR